MKNANTKHHIVPQSYLKRFARRNSNNAGYHIGVYQLESKKIFTDAIKNVAFKNNYYDVTNKGNSKYWEKYFADNIEHLYGMTLTNIISTITLSNFRNNILSDIQRKNLAKMSIFQILRVPGFLKRRFEHGKGLLDKTTEEILHLSNDKKKDNFVKDSYIESIADEAILDFLSHELNNKVLLIYYNNSRTPFITSDSPVVMYNTESDSFSYDDNGISIGATFVYYPLTPKILIQMISKDFNCGIFNNLDNGLTALSDEDILFVERINQFQLKHAESQIFVHPDYLSYINGLSEN